MLSAGSATPSAVTVVALDDLERHTHDLSTSSRHLVRSSRVLARHNRQLQEELHDAIELLAAEEEANRVLHDQVAKLRATNRELEGERVVLEEQSNLQLARGAERQQGLRDRLEEAEALMEEANQQYRRSIEERASLEKRCRTLERDRDDLQARLENAELSLRSYKEDHARLLARHNQPAAARRPHRKLKPRAEKRARGRQETTTAPRGQLSRASRIEIWRKGVSACSSTELSDGIVDYDEVSTGPSYGSPVKFRKLTECLELSGKSTDTRRSGRSRSQGTGVIDLTGVDDD